MKHLSTKDFEKIKSQIKEIHELNDKLKDCQEQPNHLTPKANQALSDYRNKLECVICYKSEFTFSLDCKHTICFHCTKSLPSRNFSCPVCRRNLEYLR